MRRQANINLPVRNDQRPEKSDSDDADMVSVATTSEPNTPILLATASMTSSISTLDGGLDYHAEGGLREASLSLTLSVIDESEDMTPSASFKALPEDEPVSAEPEAIEEDSSAEWVLEEVGRGLANYNSAQIEKVKGLKRYERLLIDPLFTDRFANSHLFMGESSYIAQLLGYADSEYVVENITIRIPP